MQADGESSNNSVSKLDPGKPKRQVTQPAWTKDFVMGKIGLAQ